MIRDYFEYDFPIEEYSAKRGSSPIWFISRKMAKQDFVYYCWQWLAVTLTDSYTCSEYHIAVTSGKCWKEKIQF